MSGRHPFQELSREFTAELRQRIDAIKRELLAEMPQHELHCARTLTQQDLAGAPPERPCTLHKRLST